MIKPAAINPKAMIHGPVFKICILFVWLNTVLILAKVSQKPDTARTFPTTSVVRALCSKDPAICRGPPRLPDTFA